MTRRAFVRTRGVMTLTPQGKWLASKIGTRRIALTPQGDEISTRF